MTTPTRYMQCRVPIDVVRQDICVFCPCLVVVVSGGRTPGTAALAATAWLTNEILDAFQIAMITSQMQRRCHSLGGVNFSVSCFRSILESIIIGTTERRGDATARTTTITTITIIVVVVVAAAAHG